MSRAGDLACHLLAATLLLCGPAWPLSVGVIESETLPTGHSTLGNAPAPRAMPLPESLDEIAPSGLLTSPDTIDAPVGDFILQDLDTGEGLFSPVTGCSDAALDELRGRCGDDPEAEE